MVITRRSQIPGSRFKPEELELVNYYLHRRVDREKTSSFIPDMNMYEKEPWLLQHVRHIKTKKNVWFYFVTRTQPAGIKKADAKKVNRRAGGGRWKTNGRLLDVKDNNGVKVGSKQLITFNYKANVEDKSDKATGWVMHEYLLDKPGFQKLALCKIKFKPGDNNAQYAPRLESILVGHPQPQPQPQPPLGENQQGFGQHQDFGSCGQLVGAHQQNDILGPVMAPQAVDEQQWNVHSRPYSAQPYDPSQVPQGPYSAQPYDTSQLPQAMEEQQWNVHSGPYSAQPYDPSQVPQGPYSAQPYDPSQGPQAMEEQQWNMHSGPYSAQPYDPSQLPQAMEEQLWDVQYQQWLMEQQQNEIIEQPQPQPPLGEDLHVAEEIQYSNGQHQDFGSLDQLVGDHQQNNIVGQEMAAQAMEEQQWNVHSGPYSAQPNDPSKLSMDMQPFWDAQNQQWLAEQQQNEIIDQAMEQLQRNERIENNDQDWDALISSIDFEGLFEDIDLPDFPMELQEQFILQQQRPILGEETQLSSHLPYMKNLEEEQYAHPYHQYFGQNNGLSMVPMETQNQENVIGNLTEEQHQPCDRPINQGIDEPPHGGIAGSSTHNNLSQQSLGDEAAMNGHDMVWEKHARRRN